MTPLDPWDPLVDKWDYMDQAHITDWPIECLEVLVLSSNLCRQPEIALMLNLPIERVQAWFDFCRTRLFGSAPDGIAAPEPVSASQHWIWMHRRCCVRDAWDEFSHKYYVLAELHGIDQPSAKVRQLFESIANQKEWPPHPPETPGPSQRRRKGRERRP